MRTHEGLPTGSAESSDGGILEASQLKPLVLVWSLAFPEVEF